MKLMPPPTVVRARELGIETFQPEKVRSGEFPARMRTSGFDIAVVVAYGRILTKEVLDGPRLGCINVHASLLPRWRGAAPIQWSILAGDPVTGVTIQQMVEALDAGDVLSMASTPIGPRETAVQLAERLAPMGAALLVETLAQIDTLQPTPQDPTGVTLARLLSKEDGKLDWSRPAIELDRQVRGLTPWPGTFATFRGEVLRVLDAEPIAGEGPPGTLLGGAAVATGAGALRLLTVQAPGRKAVSGIDFFNGHRAHAGERFE